MLTLSQLLLALACLLGVLLLYRQPHKLNEASKIYTRLIFVCCMFLFASTLVKLLVTGTEQTLVLLTIVDNLQSYLAIPLLCSLFVCIRLKKHFSLAAWGRWSLVLIASFEICRRAEIAQSYNDALILSACLFIAGSVLYKSDTNLAINFAIKLLAVGSFISAMLIFSTNNLLTLYANSALFNITLGIAVGSLCYIFGKQLGHQSGASD